MQLMTQTAEHEQIASAIRQYIDEEICDQPDLELTNDFPLVEQGILDSIQIMRLITFIQEELDYVVAPDELVLENFESIDAIAELVSRSGE